MTENGSVSKKCDAIELWRYIVDSESDIPLPEGFEPDSKPFCPSEAHQSKFFKQTDRSRVDQAIAILVDAEVVSPVVAKVGDVGRKKEIRAMFSRWLPGEGDEQAMESELRKALRLKSIEKNAGPLRALRDCSISHGGYFRLPIKRNEVISDERVCRLAISDEAPLVRLDEIDKTACLDCGTAFEFEPSKRVTALLFTQAVTFAYNRSVRTQRAGDIERYDHHVQQIRKFDLPGVKEVELELAACPRCGVLNTRAELLGSPEEEESRSAILAKIMTPPEEPKLKVPLQDSGSCAKVTPFSQRCKNCQRAGRAGEFCSTELLCKKCQREGRAVESCSTELRPSTCLGTPPAPVVDPLRTQVNGVRVPDPGGIAAKYKNKEFTALDLLEARFDRPDVCSPPTSRI